MWAIRRTENGWTQNRVPAEEAAPLHRAGWAWGYSEHCSLFRVWVTVGWELWWASQVTSSTLVHSWAVRVRVLLQLYWPSFSQSPLLASWLFLLLPSTFQLRVQSEGKPWLARHISVAVLLLDSSSLEGGSTVRVGARLPGDKHFTSDSTTTPRFKRLSLMAEMNFCYFNHRLKPLNVDTLGFIWKLQYIFIVLSNWLILFKTWTWVSILIYKETNEGVLSGNDYGHFRYSM